MNRKVFIQHFLKLHNLQCWLDIFRKKGAGFILLCVFILSRIFFINPLPVFFDSPEYLSRFSNPNYFQAIVSGHMPFHAGYIMIFWPIFHIAAALRINPSSAVIFAQIIFSSAAIYCLYRVLKIITNEKIAIITAIVCSLTPLYWVTNVSIMTESTYINLFFISLFFLTLYAKNKIRPSLHLIAGCALLGLALLTNLLIILWIPFLLSIMYLLKKERFYLILLSIASTIVLAVLINGYLVASASHISFANGVYQYLFGEDIKVAPDITSIIAVLRFIRNAFIPVLQNDTVIICILSFISLVKIFKENRKLFIIAFLWICPFILTNQWFDPLLFGRHGSIANFGLAFLVAIFLEKRRKLFFIIIVCILIVSLPALNLLRQPIPYLEMSKFIRTLPKGLLIESHFARPQIEGYYSGEIIFVNESGWNKDKLEATIDRYLKKSEPIFITFQALSDPYGVYSGPFLYPLSLSYANKFELENIIPLYSLKKYATIDKDAGITVYKIISKEKSKYPDIPRLNYNRRRIDYFDPLSQLWFFIERAKIIQSQSIMKG